MEKNVSCWGFQFYFLYRSPLRAEPSLQAISDSMRGQETQLEMLRSRFFKQPDVLSSPREQGADKPRFPSESPCFLIRSVEWHNASEFPWLASTLPVVGACVGAQGLKGYRQWLTAQLLERGFVTSLVGIPAQDLSQGHLIVEIIPGRIGVIREEGPRIGLPRSLFPVAHRDLLNIRALDQALESIRRLPGQALTTLELVPGDALGESDIVIRHPQASRRMLGVLTLDNAGLILNSSSASQTVLGGTIGGNAQLGAKPANVILNEVTGKAGSSIKGMLEVAGQSAHVIVVNPNGITADGAGFINASRLSLVAGQAVFDKNKALVEYKTGQGQIRIEGAGLNAPQAEQVDLIARTLQVNAALQAKKLGLIA